MRFLFTIQKPCIQVFGQYYGLVMNILILVFSGWNSFVPAFKPSLFLSNYLNW